MTPLTINDIQRMSREELETALENRVYEAACFIERLEDAGLVLGNGHHAAQKIAAFAVADLKSRWRPMSERNKP